MCAASARAYCLFLHIVFMQPCRLHAELHLQLTGVFWFRHCCACISVVLVISWLPFLSSIRTGHALEMAWGDVRTPLSRKLLAVPFVGKDLDFAESAKNEPEA